MLAKREKRDRMNGDGSNFSEKWKLFVSGGGLALAQPRVKRKRGSENSAGVGTDRRRR